MMRKYALLLMVLMLLLSAVLPATAQDEQPPLIGEVILERVGSTDAPEFTVFYAALQIADPAYLDRLTNPDTAAATFTTVFAPTDEAFNALMEETGMTVEVLAGNPSLVSTILAHHILPGIFTAENLASRESALFGTFVPHNALSITTDGETVMINDATVVEADIPAFNGTIHVVDKVLLPHAAVEAMMATEPEATAEPEMAAPEQSIYEILQTREDFSYFLELMELMGFQTDLSITHYTLFLPTNDVFDAFLEAQGITKEDLFANTDTITPIAFYHFLSGTFTSADVAEAFEVGGADLVFGTQQPGTYMTLSVEGETITVDGGMATVVEADILATNGVIHVIDNILLPSGQ